MAHFLGMRRVGVGLDTFVDRTIDVGTRLGRRHVGRAIHVGRVNRRRGVGLRAGRRWKRRTCGLGQRLGNDILRRQRFATCLGCRCDSRIFRSANFDAGVEDHGSALRVDD
jgi:hypothetical protein